MEKKKFRDILPDIDAVQEMTVTRVFHGIKQAKDILLNLTCA
jgi:hypothetical protein